MAAPTIQTLPPAPTIYMAHDAYATAARTHVGAWPAAVAQINTVTQWIVALVDVELPAVELPPATPDAAPSTQFATLADVHVASWQTFVDQVNALVLALSELLPVADPPLIATLPPAPTISSPYTAFAARAKAFAAAWPAFGNQLNTSFAWISAAATTAPDFIDFSLAFSKFAEDLPPTFVEN
jgi:hypothetical protein